MAQWRALLGRYRHLALLLIAIAFATKAIIPAGLMLTPANGTVIVTICSGQGPAMVAMTLGNGAKHHGNDQQDKKADHPCAFSSLNMAAAAGADIALLGVAIAYLLAAGILPRAPRHHRAPSHLRPPLRAPPVFG